MNNRNERTHQHGSERLTDTWQWIDTLKSNGTLVRLSVVKEKGVHLSIPGRILNYDVTNESLIVYNVDEKKVHCITLNEIDDVTIAG